MKIYIDTEYCLHTTNSDDLFKEVILSEKASSFFNGKCVTFVEGYRYIPYGESWIRSDGVVFRGEMIAPWKPYSELDNAQREHEKQLLAEYEAALAASIPVSDLTAAYQEGVNSV